MDLGGIGWGGIDCTDLSQDRAQWRALVIVVIHLRVPYNAESCVETQLVAIRVVFSSIGIVIWLVD
jgi:hypothetical protein